MHDVISTTGLTKHFGTTVAVRDLDLRVEASEIFGFIGPNGAGKTTTIRLLLDLLRPTSGTASIFGLDTRRDAAQIHRRIGYLPSSPTLVPGLSAGAFLDWMARLREVEARAQIEMLAERLGLDLERRIGELSTGNRQKVGLVQALMIQPDLLVLDEPTSSLDPVVQQEVRSLLRERAERGVTVFLSSHVLSEIETVCDRVATIVDGRLRRVDRIADLQAAPSRRLRIVVAGRTVPRLAELPTISDLQASYDDRLDRTIVSCGLIGTPEPVLHALRDHEVIDLLSEPHSLEEVFLESFEDRHTSSEVRRVA